MPIGHVRLCVSWWLMAHRLLLIDDDEAVLDVFKTLLTSRNFEVDCARDFAETQAQFAQHTYSLVIADLSLGDDDMEGLRVLQHIAQQPLKPRILICSGFWGNDIRESVLDRGADAFLAKPFVFKQLFEIIDQLLHDPAPRQPMPALRTIVSNNWTRAVGE